MVYQSSASQSLSVVSSPSDARSLVSSPSKVQAPVGGLKIPSVGRPVIGDNDVQLTSSDIYNGLDNQKLHNILVGWWCQL